MREALTDFIQEVRVAGLPVSIAESMDALRAASVVALERETLREALAAALVKDETDREVFDEIFDRFFTAGDEPSREKRRDRRAAGGEAPSRRSAGEGEGVAPEPDERREPRRAPRPAVERRPSEERLEQGRRQLEHRSRRRELLRKPFRELDPREAEELVELAAELSRRFRLRLRRRLERGRAGRLDFRRTIRRSIPRGGAAFDLEFRRRRPDRPDLLALCDVSGSVRWASEFFAAILAPCHDYFRRFRIVLYVDRPVEASFESGRLVPHGAIDLHAFSDFGRALVEIEETLGPSLGRSMVLLVLGDARNNRRPPRADVLSRLRSRVRTLWWLNPEPRGRWGQGDSTIDSYRPSCDQLLECASAGELLAALARLTARG